MRNPDRIEPVLEEISKVWKEKFPDCRFGQLMYNFFSALGDPFYYEEDEFLEALKAYANRQDPKEAIEKYREEKSAKRGLDAEAIQRYKEEMEQFFANFDYAALQEKFKKEIEKQMEKDVKKDVE